MRAHRSLLAAPLLLAFTGCTATGEFAPSELAWHGPPAEELNQVSMPVTCAPHLEYYPVGGPHNGGWDSNATTFTCGPHPGGSPDNSDFINGDHYGNDLFANEGTPAIAVVSGVITHSGYSGISGNRVTIMDSCGWHYFAAHLETIAPGMGVGANVTAGQVIGTVGDTGNAAGTQAHIHFSIYPESYNAGINPFSYLETVDSSACTGQSSIGPGQTPDPEVNPCTDADIRSSTNQSSFAVVYGGQSIGSEQGGGDGDFLVQGAYAAGAEYTVGRWGPWISHTGLWEVDALVPNTSTALTNEALYEVVFQGGRSVVPVNQQASKGSWVPLLPAPMKFTAGPRSYVGLANAGTGNNGAFAFDSVRWRYIGPEGSAGVGAFCSYSADCAGTLICGQAGTCDLDCSAAGCDVGACDMASGLCTLGSGDDGELLDEPEVDTDGDGIPNYLEGPSDPDGDGAPSWYDPDSDNDGIGDAVEGSGDSDGDGVLDSQDTDSDNDGMSDEDEVGAYPDVPLDSDLDGLPDYQDSDSDADGIPDATEAGGNSPPDDTDGDGIPNHLDSDSDDDGAPDSVEAGWEPTDPQDSDEDGRPDYLDDDTDDDGSGLLPPPPATDFADAGCSGCDAGQSNGAPAVALLLAVGVLAPLRRRAGR